MFKVLNGDQLSSENDLLPGRAGRGLWARVLPGTVIVIIALSFRCLAWAFYRSQYCHDTFDYQSLALAFRHWDFSCYSGLRTALYPGLLLLCGMRYTIVVMAQQALGVFTVLMLYDITRRLTSRRYAIVFGCVSAVALYAVFMEFMLLTETLSAFLVVASFWLYLRSEVNGSIGPLPAFFLGVIVALAALCRPNLLCLAAAYGVGVWVPVFTGGRVAKTALLRLLVLLAPVVVMVSAQCSFNALTTGQFLLSTGGGLNFFDHAGPHLQLVSDRYQPFKQIMLECAQREGLSDSAELRLIAWSALPDIQEKTGLNFAQASVRVGKMALDFYLHHPVLYLKSVLGGCVFFWSAPHCCNFENLPLWLQPWLKSVLWGQRFCLVVLNAIFLCLSPWVLWRALRQGAPRAFVHGVVLVLVGLGGCLSAALVKFAEIGRYSLPFEPLVALAAVYFIFLMIHQPSCSSCGPSLCCQPKEP